MRRTIADQPGTRHAVTTLDEHSPSSPPRSPALGDLLGSRFFAPAHHERLRRREPPPGPWRWTDDAEMACSVVAVLAASLTSRRARYRLQTTIESLNARLRRSVNARG
jgi:hypothetical protein